MVDLQSIVPIQPKTTTTQPNFTCKFCHKTYTLESWFLAHECKQMKCFNEFKTLHGQVAWKYYQMWYKHMKRPPPISDTFITSNYFRSFVNFGKFVKKVDLPFPDKFIWFMVEQKFLPAMWTTDEVYIRYIDYIDTQTPPMELVKQTIGVLIKIAIANNIDPSQVFTIIDPNELIHWIRVRKLTPWVLLNSSVFKLYFVNNTNPEQRSILESLIRPTYWIEQFQKHPDIVATIKKYITELNL